MLIMLYMEKEHADICNDPSISVRVVLRSMDSKLKTYYKWKYQLISDSARKGQEAGETKKGIPSD